MKNLFLFLVFTVFSSYCLAQRSGGSMIKDAEAKKTMKSIYTDFIIDLDQQIQSGKIKISTQPSLDQFLKKDEVQQLFHDTDFIEVINEETFDFEIQPYPVTYTGTSWESIRFELNYIHVRINDMRSFYIPNSYKKQMKTIPLQLLEELQSKNQLEYLSSYTLDQYGTYFLDAIETKYYQALKKGEIKAWKSEYNGPKNEKVEPDAFDSLFTEEYVMLNEFGEEYYSRQDEFLPSQISGIGFFYSLTQDKKGFHLDITHIAPCYNPFEMQGVDGIFPMVWGVEKEFNGILTEAEAYFIERLMEETILNALTVYSAF